ncbi:MAG: hypothetical protein JSV77_03160 [Dehalococcoidales bacterium]|nr:MAG: hypothetical protein JSV77_03160 [Dehalococcoidales bacterium]
MQWEFVVALVVAVPFVLFPVVFIWYLNIGGIYIVIKEARKKRAVLDEKHRVAMAEQR